MPPKKTKKSASSPSKVNNKSDDSAFTAEELRLEAQVPLVGYEAPTSTSGKPSKKHSGHGSAGGQYGALAGREDMDEDDDFDLDDDGGWETASSDEGLACRNPAKHHHKSNDEDWVTDDSSNFGDEDYDDGYGSSYTGDRDEEEEDPDSDYDDDLPLYEIQYDETRFYPGDVVVVKRQYLRDFFEECPVPTEVKRWIREGNARGVIRAADPGFAVQIDWIRPLQYLEAMSRVNPLETTFVDDDNEDEKDSKGKKSAQGKNNKKTGKKSRGARSQAKKHDPTENEEPALFYNLSLEETEATYMLHRINRGQPVEVGDVVRTCKKLDGGIAKKIYSLLMHSDAPLHTKGLAAATSAGSQPAVLPSASSSSSQQRYMQQQFPSAFPPPGKKGKNANTKKGSKRGGRGKNSLQEATQDEEEEGASSQQLLPSGFEAHDCSKYMVLNPFVQDAFVQTRDGKKRGFVKELHGEVLLRFRDGSIAISCGMKRNLACNQGDSLVPPMQFGEYALEEENFTLHYLLGKEDKEAHYEGMVLFIFPKFVVLGVSNAGVSDGIEEVGIDLTESGQEQSPPQIFNSFQCSGLHLGGLAFFVGDQTEWCGPRMQGDPAAKTNTDAKQNEDQPRPSMYDVEGIDTLQHSRHSALSVEEASSFYAPLWGLPSDPAEYQSWFDSVFYPQFATKIVQIQDISTMLTIMWQSGKEVTTDGSHIAPSVRNDYPETEIAGENLEHFTSDLVIPSAALALKLAACEDPNEAEGGGEEEGHSGPLTHRALPSSFKGKPRKPILTSKCSHYDMSLFYPVLETEVVCQDLVEQRAVEDVYLMQGSVPGDDPPFIGVLNKKITPFMGTEVPQVFDHEDQYEVKWYKQRPETLRKLLLKDGKQRGEQVVAGLEEAAGGGVADDADQDNLAPLSDEIVKAALVKSQDVNDVLHHPPPQVGEVVGMLPDTRLRVQWADGHQSICFRHELSVIRVSRQDEYDDDGLSVGDDDDDDELFSEALAGAPVVRPASLDGSDAASPTSASGVTPTTIIQGAGRLLKVTASTLGHVVGRVFSALGNGSRALSTNGNPGNNSPLSAPSTPLGLFTPPTAGGNNDDDDDDDDDDEEQKDEHAEEKPVVEDKDATAPPSPSSDLVPAAEVFQVCSHFSSHLLSTPQAADNFKPLNFKAFHKKVHAEWALLRSSLGTAYGVHCKVTESHSHLLKFALEGPMHTPYYQGFYSFDVLLPDQYPEVPPEVRFHSKGLKINPNLYPDGKICLSLLGTWHSDSPQEEWQPKSSNLLQVILSIQGLILVKEPFYNEAGFEAKRGLPQARGQSKQFNEKTYLSRLAHLMSTAQSNDTAPPDFVFEFRSHYLKVVPAILRRAKSYLAADPAAPVAGGDDVGAMNSDGLVLPLSIAFLTSLATSVDALEAQYKAVEPVWVKEAEIFSLPQLDSEDEE